MAIHVNMDELERYTPEVQDGLRSALTQQEATLCADSAFKNVLKSPGYLSEWSDDIVQIDVSSDRTRNETLTFDLNETFIQCKGALSLFTGIMPLVAFPNLVQSAKGLLNILDGTFEGNTKKASTITNGFHDVCRYFSYMISNKGVYRLDSLTRHDFVDFLQDMKSKGGWTNLLQLDESLRQLILDIENRSVSIADVCSPRHNDGSYRVSIRRDFINKYTGIPGATGHLPRWFYDELLKFHDDKFSVNVGIDTGFSSVVAYSHIKSINRLYNLPDNIDKPRFRPYSDSIAMAYQISGNEPNRLAAKQSDGRTANLSLENALKLFGESLKWIYDYSCGILAIFELYRTNLEGLMPEFERIKYGSAQSKLSNDVDLELESSCLCHVHNLPFKSVVLNAHCQNYDAILSPSVNDLVSNLQTACFIQIATNHGRRLNEVVGSHQLKYGLYFGCIIPSDETKGLNFIDIYIEKTFKDYGRFYANDLVLDAVKVLERISQIFRPLLTEPKEYQKEILLARKDKLFTFREFTLKSFLNEPYSYNFSTSSEAFFHRAGVVDPALDHRSQPFRRFFALLYYYRYDIPNLLSVMDALGQLDPATTSVYLNDPLMRKSRDRIDELYFSRIKEETRQVQADMDDVRTEMFVTNVIEILNGKRTGGTWPLIVLMVYQNMAEHAEFNDLDLKSQGTEVAQHFLEEGYHRVPFAHGGCNVGTTEVTLPEARCKREDEDLAHLEEASPEVCVDCIHHDCSQANIQRLRSEIDRLRQIEEDFSQPSFIRFGNQEQRESLERVLQSELHLEQRNRQLLYSMAGEFTKLASNLKLLEER